MKNREKNVSQQIFSSAMLCGMLCEKTLQTRLLNNQNVLLSFAHNTLKI
jgi:hypothetical protein